MNPILPQADLIPVSWGWLQLLLLVTFPLHLLAMNAMLGGLAVAAVEHLRGGAVRRQLAHRLAVALPLVIAFVVNLGVAPLLFVQVLYGQFFYSSSILMGSFWLLIIPVLIVAYYGAYLYDFRFNSLGAAGPWLAILVFILLALVGFFLVNNMLLMVLPARFGEYLSHRSGSLLVFSHPEFWPRFLHMVFGALAIGGLFVGLLGRFRSRTQAELAAYAERVGLSWFVLFTLGNVIVGFWYFLALPAELRRIFIGGGTGATAVFILSFVLTVGALVAAHKKRFWPTLIQAISLVVLMTFLRGWLRAGYLREVFALDQLQVAPQYSSMIFFFVTLAVGSGCLAWLTRKTMAALPVDEAGKP